MYVLTSIPKIPWYMYIAIYPFRVTLLIPRIANIERPNIYFTSVWLLEDVVCRFIKYSHICLFVCFFSFSFFPVCMTGSNALHSRNGSDIIPMLSKRYELGRPNKVSLIRWNKKERNCMWISRVVQAFIRQWIMFILHTDGSTIETHVPNNLAVIVQCASWKCNVHIQFGSIIFDQQICSVPTFASLYSSFFTFFVLYLYPLVRAKKIVYFLWIFLLFVFSRFLVCVLFFKYFSDNFCQHQAQNYRSNRILCVSMQFYRKKTPVLCNYRKKYTKIMFVFARTKKCFRFHTAKQNGC